MSFFLTVSSTSPSRYFLLLIPIQNDDLAPVPPENRTWKAINFVTFWIADSFNINTWMIVSSMVQLGLSWWQAWLCVWLGYGFVAPFICLNARPGAIFHITFPVVARTSFGIYGSLWCTFNRGAMACIWYGVQAWIGGECMKVMLRAMWPSVENIPNSLPESSGTNTRDFVCFFLFWLISLPAIWFPIHQIRHLFTFKSIVTPIAGIAFFIWCIVKAKAWARLSNSHPPFAALSWAGAWSSTPSAALYPQLWSVPLGFSIVSFVGIIPIWSPIELLGRFLDNNPSSATRFGVWYIAFSFIVAQLGTNISANSISAGCDLTALFPRFINIRRGGYIAAIVGLCMLPWNLLKDSNSFTSYLSAYSVFLSSIAGVMITEYYVIRRGHYRVADLYTASKDGWYYYTYGVNFRAYAAYISGILINVVGFAGATGRDVPLAATRIYQMSFFTGFGVSSLMYYTLNRLFPVPGMADKFEEIDLSNYDYVPGHGESSHEHGRSSDEGSIDSKKDETKDEKFTISSHPVV
ncbi:permease for cytosine/purines, uracil, thiamine, allantoin-domain-containing protein [Coprinopsis sp. MPI-PUGE-AT-0042]|nr:permease for cytosine/purines, uracil, thiamine, allantoin-domain-containing protein [Coprinopsis sp. MPI-PUGE-AT-0042]